MSTRTQVTIGGYLLAATPVSWAHPHCECNGVMQHSTVLHSAQYRADLISSDSSDLSPALGTRRSVLVSAW